MSAFFDSGFLGHGPWVCDGPWGRVPSLEVRQKPFGDENGPLSGPWRGPIEMFLCDHVKPVRGSVVCCRLAGVLDHSGVYVGNGMIVHRDGDGYLAKVGMQEFLERLGGLNPAITIFVSCHEGEPVGEDVIAQRALEAMGNPSLSQGYDLLTKNCHQFCQYCVTGKVDNGITDFTFSNLEGVLQRELGMDGWRVWDGCWAT